MLLERARRSRARDGVTRIKLFEHALGVSPTVELASNQNQVVGVERVLTVQNRRHGGFSFIPFRVGPVGEPPQWSRMLLEGETGELAPLGPQGVMPTGRDANADPQHVRIC